jgi:hypothetical protein
MRHEDWPLPARAFHIAEAENWNSIRRTGLHSTAALIARDGLSAAAAQPFATYRGQGMRLPSGAVIRDQCPMPPSALMRCLDAGLTPQTWYDLVNSKVFFWLQAERLDRHLAACRARPQIVVAVDLRELLRRYRDSAFVTPFNVGNARRRPASRGHRTFVPLGVWLDNRWATEAPPGARARARNHPPAEMAIEGSVPDLMEFVLEARPAGPVRSCRDA